ESAGIATIEGGKITVLKEMGLVSEALNTDKLIGLQGTVGIGHVRYSTTGSSNIVNAQPFFYESKKGPIAMAFNGNILNYPQIKKALEKKGYLFHTSTDTESIIYLIEEELRAGRDWMQAISATMGQLDGAYSILILTSEGKIIAFRDPQGFKPFCIGRKNGNVIIASESCALDALGVNYERDIEPGEICIVSKKDSSSKLALKEQHSHCMFEYVYFARPDSVISGRVVADARYKMGVKLGEKNPLPGVDTVIPIPDSGRSAALGYADATGKKYAEGLQKNRYVHRTFIMPQDEQRKNMISLKLNPVRSRIEGKKIALVDDSIVRGNTIKKIIKLLRACGAKEVHLLIACPPVIHPCYMGVDFSTYKELIATDKTIEQIRDEIGADSVYYNTIESLVDAIGLPKGSLCLACLTGEYPTKHDPNVKE
ncbi:amidophosphoribosyltransferase, partial [Candidatus Micrarchaeota archaeon]|nr:amidophosphoribosyltransferase [Candidatus Micrarchaeota archaeon]